MSFRRRTMLGSAASAVTAASLAGSTFGSRSATASVAGDVELRGSTGRLERLPSLDLESQHDFVTGMRVWNNKALTRPAMRRVDELMKAKGMDPKAKVSFQEMLDLVEKDPVVNISALTWLSNQQITWKILQDYFHENADLYLSEMEAADKSGPGTLELNPDMNIPDYARHEIHIQPGGYVGDPFAGHLYHYGTNSFYVGTRSSNEQDEIHRGTAANLPVPADGKVKRILDLGCGVGQFSVALKERFPDAEVWGIDVGGPMVRYAHMRARDLGVDVNFTQRLAEDTKFPDGHFDIVTSYIIHHELPQEISRKLIAEAYRITRVGGYYYPIDFNSGGETGPAYSQFRRWWDHRWNNEVWSREYHTLDFEGEMVKAGFTMNQGAKPALAGFGTRHAVKIV